MFKSLEETVDLEDLIVEDKPEISIEDLEFTEDFEKV